MTAEFLNPAAMAALADAIYEVEGGAFLAAAHRADRVMARLDASGFTVADKRAEAVAAERERIRAAVEGLDASEFIDDYGDDDRPGTTYFAIDRDAVLAIVEADR